MRIFLSALTLSAALCFSSWLHACNDPQITGILTPAQSIQTTLDKISAFHHRADAHEPAALHSFVADELMSCFAFEAMAQWIIGPYARHMSAADEAGFVLQLKQSFFGSLTKLLENFNPDNNPVHINKTRFTRTNLATVGVQIYRGQLRPVNLSFRLRLENNSWKVVDIRASGTSLVLYYRTRFITQLRAFRH